MSADNGIYVLFTESEKGPEYRVAHAHAIGNIYGEWNDESGRYAGNTDVIKNVFGESQAFYTLNEALDAAEGLQYDIGDTEDGICVINEFKDYGWIFE
jgi:hypothetical protein